MQKAERSLRNYSGLSDMTISYEDFEKVDIRVGKVIDIQDFPKAKKPAYQFTIDFGPEIGIKRSSAQAAGAHTKEELLGKLVCCVINFPPKRVADFESQVLTLGFKNTKDIGWVLISPLNENVELGSKLA